MIKKVLQIDKSKSKKIAYFTIEIKIYEEICEIGLKLNKSE